MKIELRKWMENGVQKGIMTIYICAKCDSKVDHTDNYCRNCGKELKRALPIKVGGVRGSDENGQL